VPTAAGPIRSLILRWRRGSKRGSDHPGTVPLVGVVEVPSETGAKEEAVRKARPRRGAKGKGDTPEQ
jgi:hypothetical protein